MNIRSTSRWEMGPPTKGRRGNVPVPYCGDGHNSPPRGIKEGNRGLEIGDTERSPDENDEQHSEDFIETAPVQTAGKSL